MDFNKYPLWLNLLIFSVVAVVVWLGGTRLAEYADELAQRYHFSRAFTDSILVLLVYGAGLSASGKEPEQ